VHSVCRCILISSIIAIIDTARQVYETVDNEAGLSTNFKKSATKLPLVSELLENTGKYVDTEADEATRLAFTPTLNDCKDQAAYLQQLFEKIVPKDGDSRWNRYLKAARTIGKGGYVEMLIGGILDNLQLLATNFPQVSTSRGKEELAKAIEEVSKMEPSLPEGFEKDTKFANYGNRSHNFNMGGNQYNNNSTGNQNNGPSQQFIGPNHIGTPFTLQESS
jgi:hypothetical protein